MASGLWERMIYRDGEWPFGWPQIWSAFPSHKSRVHINLHFLPSHPCWVPFLPLFLRFMKINKSLAVILYIPTPQLMQQVTKRGFLSPWPSAFFCIKKALHTSLFWLDVNPRQLMPLLSGSFSEKAAKVKQKAQEIRAGKNQQWTRGPPTSLWPWPTL